MQTQRRLLLRAGALFGLVGVAGRMVVQAQGKPRVIPIVARKFTYAPAEITLKVNEPVVFQLTTQDVVMGFSVPDFAVRGTIIPGQTTEVPMTPTKTGEFIFLCDVFCGSGHENMEGMLRVVA
jgi:cytochrome c oxidase subunit 2